MADSNKGVAFGAIAVGSLLVYSGMKGYSLLKAALNVVTGKAASTGQTTNPLTTPSVSTTASLGTGNGAALVAYATSDIGHCYLFGGAPGTNGAGCWDCSSAVNWWVGHDAGLAIPFYGAGKYNGTAHGPPTGTWLVWTGCQTIKASEAEPGDIVVGVSHMGIYSGGGNYISAHDPAEGTTQKPVTTFPDPIMLYRRLIALEASDSAPQQSLADVEAQAGRAQ